MPSLSNTIHNTTIYGQIYRRGVLQSQTDFVRTTMHNIGMLRQISRFDKSLQYKGRIIN
jgi:hypothetical protein